MRKSLSKTPVIDIIGALAIVVSDQAYENPGCNNSGFFFGTKKEPGYRSGPGLFGENIVDSMDGLDDALHFDDLLRYLILSKRPSQKGTTSPSCHRYLNKQRGAGNPLWLAKFSPWRALFGFGAIAGFFGFVATSGFRDVIGAHYQGLLPSLPGGFEGTGGAVGSGVGVGAGMAYLL